MNDEQKPSTDWCATWAIAIACMSLGLSISSCASSCAHAAPISVYWIAGQSNAVGFAPSAGLPSYLTEQTDVIYRSTAGPVRPALQPIDGTFGPELTFGRAMADATGEKIAVVKVAWGSTSLETDWDPATGKRFGQFVARMDSTVNYLRSAGYTPTVRGGVWVQGEEDAFYGPMAQAYGANLADLLVAVREKWGPALPVAVARINAPYRPYRADVRAGELAAADALTSVWDTDDLPLLDKVHYNQAGQLRLGSRMAAAMLAERYESAQWVGGAAVPEPDAATILMAALAVCFALSLLRPPRRRR